MILGPSVGGVTYEWSGFALPFLLFAGLSLASAALYAASYPSLDPVTGGESIWRQPCSQTARGLSPSCCPVYADCLSDFFSTQTHTHVHTWTDKKSAPVTQWQLIQRPGIVVSVAGAFLSFMNVGFVDVTLAPRVSLVSPLRFFARN